MEIIEKFKSAKKILEKFRKNMDRKEKDIWNYKLFLLRFMLI